MRWKDGITRTLASTAINSAHAEWSTAKTCWRADLRSSSFIGTSEITLLTASWANCFAAVCLTEGEEPVSKRRRSLSNLNARMSRQRARRTCKAHTLKSYRTGPVPIQRVIWICLRGACCPSQSSPFKSRSPSCDCCL